MADAICMFIHFLKTFLHTRRGQQEQPLASWRPANGFFLDNTAV
jgi:hypothetical protein